MDELTWSMYWIIKMVVDFKIICQQRRRIVSLILYDFLEYMISRKLLTSGNLTFKSIFPAIELLELDAEYSCDYIGDDIHSTVFIDSTAEWRSGLKPDEIAEFFIMFKIAGKNVWSSSRRLAFTKIIPRAQNVRSGLNEDNSGTLLKVYATKQFLFNSTQQCPFVECRIIKSFRYVDVNAIYQARQIFITRIFRQIDNLDQSPSRHIDHSLREYFSQKRLMKQGDVVLIYDGITNFPIYFKVSQMLGHATPGVTDQISQEVGMTTAFVSANFTKCVEDMPKHGGEYAFTERIGIRFIPTSLRNGVRKVTELFSLAMQSADFDNQYVISVPMCIVSMAENVGSARLFVDQLADEMCAGITVVDCTELEHLMRQSSGHHGSVSTRTMITERLNSMFSNAQQYAPSLIWLKDLATFRKHSSPPGDMEFIVKSLENSLKTCGVTLRKLRNKQRDGEEIHGRIIGVVTVCSSEQLSDIPERLSPFVHTQVNVDRLSTADRHRFFHEQIRHRFGWLTDSDLFWFTDQTKGFSLSELEQLVDEVCEVQTSRHYYSEECHTINRCDFNEPLRQRQVTRTNFAGAPKVPTVTWEDVGALEDVKSLISESIRVNSFDGDEISQISPNPSSSWRRSGILLYGPPGCGKTLIAKAVANQFKMTFLSIKGPELLNQYVGQSEKNLRDVFARARAAAPAILFFDELDSLASSRGCTGDSGGVMDRMVSQLLAEMDSIQYDANATVFVMAATNRPDLLDPCLTTPGRFDKSVLVRPAEDVESKVRILQPVCKRLYLELGLDVVDIARMCPDTMSGADLHALMSNATMSALRETIELLENKTQGNNSDMVCTGLGEALLIPDVLDDNGNLVIRRCHVMKALPHL